MRIALAQVDCDLGDVEANLARARVVVAEAKDRGAELVVFPELTLTGYSLGQVGEDVSLPADDPRLTELAGELAVVIGFAERGRLHTYNSAAYLAGGELRLVHRKLYLTTYDIYEERKHFSPGQALRSFPLGERDDERGAILICNDAWQPALPFLAVQDGASVLLVMANSAASPSPELFDTSIYWRDINRVYARMYESVVVFVNRVGEEGELSFWGRSSVIDCTGEVVAEAPAAEEALLVVDVDLAAVRARRHALPLVREARLGLLRRELGRLIEEGGDA
ncbi:MAG: amidohydrolase [Actinomycetota bacterium]|nr:amidohydrolase [Actinomycetota bacterium]